MVQPLWPEDTGSPWDMDPAHEAKPTKCSLQGLAHRKHSMPGAHGRECTESHSPGGIPPLLLSS